MKHFLLIACLLLAIGCTKTGDTVKRDYRCIKSISHSYRSTDSAYYLTHGSYRFTTINVSDTLYNYDTTAILNYMLDSENRIMWTFQYMIADTAVYMQKTTDCTRLNK